MGEKSVMTETGRVVVCLVDDCSVVRGALTEMLTVLGFDVISASSGHQALAKLGEVEAPLSLAVLDMQMPGMTGAQTLSRPRVLRPELPASGLRRSSQPWTSLTIRASFRSGWLEKGWPQRD